MPYKDRYKARANSRERTRRWIKRNPEKQRAAQKRWRHARPPTPTRPEPAACECCGAMQKAALCLDHDHTTNEFRGWLCHKCNLGLGMLGDTVDAIARLYSYLTRGNRA